MTDNRIEQIKKILDKVTTSRQYGYITESDKRLAATEIVALYSQEPQPTSNQTGYYGNANPEEYLQHGGKPQEPQQVEKGQPLPSPELEEEIDIVLNKPENVVCPECKGTGRFIDFRCVRCDGTGKVPQQVVNPDLVEDGFGSAASAICPTCGLRAVYVNRPGDIRCHVCYDNNPKEWYESQLKVISEFCHKNSRCAAYPKGCTDDNCCCGTKPQELLNALYSQEPQPSEGEK
jgi:hypothetical protein